ncbi:phosphotransferase [Streptomyces sp. NPDC017673]|uniref:phosphotransferase n=1 Tax=unclassified Streptomyces TaxID=2593676 RepID=UPI003795FE5A
MSASSGTEAVPWRHSGWATAATARIDAALAHEGISRTGPVTEVKNWVLSAVLRCPTPQGPVYYKQALPCLAHEGPLLARLGARRPGLVPTVLAPDLPGPGWCTRGVRLLPGTGLPERARGDALRELAVLQRRLLEEPGRVAELTGLGCWDRRADALAREARALAGRADVFGPDAPLPDALTPREARSWAEALRRIPSWCAELATQPPGDTLVHGDLHPGNWGVGAADGRIMLLDWAEAAVGHPFLDIAPALRSATDAAERARALARCFTGWVPLMSPARCAAVWRIAEPVAALNQVVTYVRFHDETAPPERRNWAPRVLWWARRLIGLLDGAGRRTP